MSSRELNELMEMLSGLILQFLPTIIAGVVAAYLVTFAIRWFVFVKAGEKGWKSLIPFYSDYITYKIAWDGKVYLYLIGAQVGSMILSAIFSAIHPVMGAVLGTPLVILSTGVNSLAGMLMHFKMARAFGHKDFFAVGLWLFNNVFMTVLAFGDSVYQGPVPGIIPGNLERKAQLPGKPAIPAQPQPQPQPQMQPQMQPQQQAYAPQQAYAQQQVYAQQQAYGQQYGYPQQEQPRASRRSQNGGYYDQR